MFTGIIEAVGKVKQITVLGTNKTFWIESTLSPQLKVDQSISHNGVCLTVEELREGNYRVTAVKETLQKTTLGKWEIGDKINLERCLLLTDRLDGHFVQGHVDVTGTCTKIKNASGSWELTFEYPKRFAHLIIEKGSISVNGISFTAFNVRKNTFQVAVIPFTWQHTNLSFLKKGRNINLEFDLIGKYIYRKLSL